MQGEILHARVNSIIGVCFIGVFVLGAVLIIWHAVNGHNPVADALVPYATPDLGQ